jgi:anti-anti-sigma factor
MEGIDVTVGEGLDAPLDIPDHPIAKIQAMGAAAVATLTVDALTEEHGAGELTGLMELLGASGARHIVLDIQNLQHIDSTCIACLVKALNDVSEKRGRIALVNPDYSMQRLFRMTKLDRRFPICHDVMSALAAVERDA